MKCKSAILKLYHIQQHNNVTASSVNTVRSKAISIKREHKAALN